MYSIQMPSWPLAPLKPLEIEGVRVVIDWDEFIVGSSFFIPCIDDSSVKNKLATLAAAQEIKIKTRARIENGLWGVRVWRVA